MLRYGHLQLISVTLRGLAPLYRQEFRRKSAEPHKGVLHESLLCAQLRLVGDMPEAAAAALCVHRTAVLRPVRGGGEDTLDASVGVASEHLDHPAGNNVPDGGHRHENRHSAPVGAVFFIVTHAAALVCERSYLQRDDVVLCQRHQISPRLFALR